MNLLITISLTGAMLMAAGSCFADEGEARYMEFPNVLPGKILKVQKQLDPSTGRMELISNLPEISDISDLLQWEAAEESFRRRQRGSLDERLAGRLPNLGLLEKVRIAVRVKSAPFAYLDKTRHTEENLIANSLAALRVPPIVSPLSVLSRHGLLGGSLRGDDIAVVNAGKQALEGLRHDVEVAAVWEDRDPGILAPSLATLASSGYNPGPVPSGAGNAVRAATFERGLTPSFLSCLGVSPASYDVFGLTGAEILKRHSLATFRTLVASAPSATFYHRWSLTYNSTNDVSYIVNNAIQTVSMSLERGGLTPFRATHSEFLTMDNMAYTYPYPVFANPTANSGYGYEVNWQCYNCLSVGNVRHTNESTFEMADCTQAKNPPPRYGPGCISGSGADCAGDREMPHIVAPGIPPTGSVFDMTCLEGSGTISCGTSYSAPVANGTAAAVIAADYRMPSWPEKVRAALILTAQNVDAGHWTVSGDGRDGTGVISGADAVAFAAGHTTVSPGNAACVNGMGAASFYASDFGSNKRFNYLVPNPKPSGKHLRVVLTWDSNPNVGSGTNDLSDLDLIVQKNGGSQASTSWDSNVEVVDIAAADLTAGSSYYIDISPYANRIPSGAYFYYAIAWSWVKDHAP